MFETTLTVPGKSSPDSTWYTFSFIDILQLLFFFECTILMQGEINGCYHLKFQVEQGKSAIGRWMITLEGRVISEGITPTFLTGLAAVFAIYDMLNLHIKNKQPVLWIHSEVRQLEFPFPHCSFSGGTLFYSMCTSLVHTW